jgi:cyclic pyranopterin phosphate synthase
VSQDARLTHVDEAGRARMVDVAPKPETARVARARATVRLQPSTLQAIESGGAPKGDVLAVARVAGIQAAKRTHELIPLCHPLRLTGIEVRFEARREGEAAAIEIEATVKAFDRTGVEMEALVAASTAALTIYDMVKALDRGLVVERVELVEKLGGRSGHFVKDRGAGER